LIHSAFRSLLVPPRVHAPLRRFIQPDFEIRVAQPENGPSRVLARIPGERVPAAAWTIHPLLSPDGKWVALLRATERAPEEKEAHGEIETAHPGYLGAQDTYYVGTIKSVGRIYQQTFLDTLPRSFSPSSTIAKMLWSPQDMLNDRVLPFFEEQNVPMLRVPTDRGTEYCGQREHHEYQLYLAVERIDIAALRPGIHSTPGTVAPRSQPCRPAPELISSTSSIGDRDQWASRATNAFRGRA